MEVGVGVVNLLESNLLAYQGYATLAIHEGFQDWPIPALAARIGLSHVTGSSEARMDVGTLDLIGSKTFNIGKTAQGHVFGGWTYMLTVVRPGAIADGQGRPVEIEEQDNIVRNRFFGGLKIKFSTVFVSGQYEHIPAGNSRDKRQSSGGGADDASGLQRRLVFSAGFDF
jgi:hypothetical protein